MTIFLSYIAKKLVKIFGIVLFPWSIFLVVKECFSTLNITPWKNYWYEISRGWDILANKLYAPAFNKKLGPNFGRDESISQRMAINKYNGLSYPDAAYWEKKINIFDKDHLKKTFEKHELN